MRKATRKRLSGGVGVTFALALMIIGARYSEFFRRSPIVLDILIVAVLITLVGGLVLLFSKEDKGPPPSPVEKVSQKTRGDHSPNFNVRGDLHYTEGRSPKEFEAKREKPTPKVRVVRLERTLASEDGEFWKESLHVPGGDMVWVVKVENPPDTPCGDYVFARFEFGTGSSEVGFVARAYWLGEKINTTKIDIGQRKSVLLGMAGNGCWAYYDNPVADLPVPYTRRAAELLAQSPNQMRQQYFGLTVPVECHLTVFSADTGNIFAEAKYRIYRVSDGDVAVEEI
jgi:hypothetical protein